MASMRLGEGDGSFILCMAVGASAKGVVRGGRRWRPAGRALTPYPPRRYTRLVTEPEAPAARIGQGPPHDAGAAGPAGAVRLETERLVLREFRPRDWPRLYAIESDPEAVRYQSFGPRTAAECRAYIRLCARDRAEQPRRVYDLAVALRPDGPVIGRCGLKLTGAEPGEATLWYMVDRARWGHGYAPEAARALLDFGFAALGVHRVWADCDPANAASIRVLEKLGMRREGHLVENAWIKGAWADSLLYAILDREWRPALHPQR